MDDRLLTLLEDFAARRARGERPDPLAYLERAGDAADEMGRLIDRLVRSTPPPAAPAPEVVAMMEALATGDPPLLGARLARRLPVDALAGRLVAALGIDPALRGKVRRLYLRLEGGLLDAGRLDPRLTSALAQALGIRERDIALGTAPAGAPPAAALFTRGMPDAEIAAGAVAAEEGPRDEVDRLFGVA